MSNKLIKLQSCDGELYPVDQGTVALCTTIKNMLRGKSAFRNSLGGQFSIDGSYVILKKEGRVLATLTKNNEEEAIVTLPDVKSGTLEKVLEYCKYHVLSTASDREKKNWDTEFVQVKQSILCELASASYYLDIKPLVNLTSRAIATQISGKTSEEIRETFCNINYEVYAPVFASSLATRCRLQRKIIRKKQEKDGTLKNGSSQDDSRSVDELLSFIEESNNKKKGKKNKKKDKKKKEELNQNPNNNSFPQSDCEVDDNTDPKREDDTADDKLSKSSSEDEEQDFRVVSHEQSPNWNDLSDGEVDDINPEMQAALDQEVEEFRQRLENVNSLESSKPKIPLPVSASFFVSSLVGVH